MMTGYLPILISSFKNPREVDITDFILKSSVSISIITLEGADTIKVFPLTLSTTLV